MKKKKMKFFIIVSVVFLSILGFSLYLVYNSTGSKAAQTQGRTCNQICKMNSIFAENSCASGYVCVTTGPKGLFGRCRASGCPNDRTCDCFPTPTGSTPTATPPPNYLTPTPTVKVGKTCNQICSGNECNPGLICTTVGSLRRCRASFCPNQSSCICNYPTPTNTPPPPPYYPTITPSQ